MFQLPFSVFMMRNAFEALPRELEEAALVDGCGTFAALDADPASTACGRRSSRSGCSRSSPSWNDFFAPLILLSDGDKFTLPVAVVSIREQTFGAIDYGALEAGVMVMAVPVRRAVPGAAAPLRPRIHDRSPALMDHVRLRTFVRRRDRRRLLGRPPAAQPRRADPGRRAAARGGRATSATCAPPPAARRSAFRGMVFHDSDVYKWLEALGCELAREPSPELRGWRTRRSSCSRPRSARTAT